MWSPANLWSLAVIGVASWTKRTFDSVSIRTFLVLWKDGGKIALLKVVQSIPICCRKTWAKLIHMFFLISSMLIRILICLFQHLFSLNTPMHKLYVHPWRKLVQCLLWVADTNSLDLLILKSSGNFTMHCPDFVIVHVRLDVGPEWVNHAFFTVNQPFTVSNGWIVHWVRNKVCWVMVSSPVRLDLGPEWVITYFLQ